MGWRRLVGSLKLQVSFAEYRLFYRALLQKRPKIRYLSIENPQIRKPRIVATVASENVEEPPKRDSRMRVPCRRAPLRSAQILYINMYQVSFETKFVRISRESGWRTWVPLFKDSTVDQRKKKIRICYISGSVRVPRRRAPLRSAQTLSKNTCIYMTTDLGWKKSFERKRPRTFEKFFSCFLSFAYAAGLP